jgi:hypothetical protein
VANGDGLTNHGSHDEKGRQTSACTEVASGGEGRIKPLFASEGNHGAIRGRRDEFKCSGLECLVTTQV